MSEGDVKFLETMDKVEQHMEMLEVRDFNQKDFEEITDESDSNLETTKDKEIHLQISQRYINNSETIHEYEPLARNFQDLPDELILKLLSFSKPEDLITSGQVSKRLRKISYDNSLWQRVNVSEKIV